MKKFYADRRGSFAMQFALLVVPLTVCTGLAIDGGRAFLARYELASALDAAALAVGSTISEEADPNIIAHKFVNANFHSAHSGPIALELDPGDDEDDTVTLRGTVTIKTYFMPLVGQPTVTVAAESQVRRGGANVEVALALDVTESMMMGVDRMTPLKAAAKDLINTVVTDVQTPFYSRVAIIPWGSAVHVGDLADDLRGEDVGPVNITAADWRDGTARTISNATSTGWRKNAGGAGVSTVTWRNGTRRTASTITKVSSPSSRIEFTSSTTHGYTTGDTVHISNANGSYTGLNGNEYSVEVLSTTKFALRVLGTSTYVTPPGGSSNATQGYSQRCFNTGCEIRVTTSAANAFVAGDRIYVSGVGSPYGSVNNSANTTWGVSSAPSTTNFLLAGSNGPAVTSTSAGSGGTASECFNTECRFVVTASSHGFSDGDTIYITGASTSGSGTSINNAIWTVGNATTNTFTLPGNGPSYRDGHSGTATQCLTDTCEVRVTAPGHGLLNNDWTQISGVNGLTALNQSGNNARQVEAVSGDTFIVSGLTGAGNPDYTSAGQSQCLTLGCSKMRYETEDGSPAVVIKQISNCVTERIGAQAATDASPATAFLGPYYPAGGYNVCSTANWIAPLTDNKDALEHHIDSLTVTGSTAGHVGLAWGWYMLSPDWGTIWDTFETDEDDGEGTTNYYAPALYDAPNTSKVLILMTDGEFNTAHCDGVASADFAIENSSDINDCNADNGDPFDQAQALCDVIDPDADEKMLVFTIGFEIDAEGTVAQRLEECASKPEYFFLSESGEDLQDDFQKIAKEISKLRIAH